MRYFQLLLILQLFTFLPTTANASEFTGFASFAAMNPRFPCDAYLQAQATSERPAMVVLWGTFGYAPHCVARYAEAFRDRPHMIQIHLSNEVCRRNKRCMDNEIQRNLTIRQYNQALDGKDPLLFAELRARIAFIRDFLHSIKNENTTLVLSTGLEDNYSASAFANLLELVRDEWPHLVSRNPLLPAAGRNGADFLEAHLLNYNFNGEPCIATQDGVPGSFGHSTQFLLNYHDQCFATILWRKDSQGAAQARWRAPLKRSFKISQREVTELQRLLQFSNLLFALTRSN